MKRFLFFIIFSLGAIPLLLAQQQPLLSLQPAYPSWYNPGATAYTTGHTISMGYRSQWASIEDAPNAQLLAFDTRSADKNIFGFGATMLRQTAHRDVMFSFQARSAFHLEAATGHHFSLGIGLGVINRYRDYRRIIIEDYRDQGLLQGSTYNIWQLDASAGFQYNYQSSDGKYDFRLGMAANRLPMMFEEPTGPFRLDQVAHLTTNIQLGYKITNDLMIEPGLQQLGLISTYKLKAGGTSLWIRAIYQQKFWAALYTRPTASTFGLMMGAVLDEGKYAGTLAIDSHAQLGSTWEFGGYANFSPVAKCMGEIEIREAFWYSDAGLNNLMGPLFEANGLNFNRITCSHQYAGSGLLLNFGISEEDESEMIWKTLPESENIVRVICSDVLRDALEICKEPHLEAITKITLTYYTDQPLSEWEKLSDYSYDGSMGDGLNLVGKVDGKVKRRAIFEGDKLSKLEFQLAKMYSLQERLLYRLSDLGIDKSMVEVQMVTSGSREYPYEIGIELR